MQVGIDIGNESDGYRLTVGGYSADAGIISNGILSIKVFLSTSLS